MKILNVKEVKTISKSKQKSILGGSISLYECWLDCMKTISGDPGSYQEKVEFCEKVCRL